MADFFKLGVILCLLGYEAAVFGIIQTGSGKNEVEAMMVLGVLCYTAAVILVVLQALEELSKGDMPVAVSTIVLLLLAGIFIIIGMVTWSNNNNSSYKLTLDSVGAMLGITSGVFFILIMAGVGK